MKNIYDKLPGLFNLSCSNVICRQVGDHELPKLADLVTHSLYISKNEE